MRTIADWLASEGVPVWLWTAWIQLWLRCSRIRHYPRSVELCDSCSEPCLRIDVSLRALRDGSIVYQCHECQEIGLMLRAAEAIRGVE